MAKLQAPPPATVTLELDADEAQVLVQILWRVGGSTTRSRRKHANEIQRVLQEAGFRPGPDSSILGNIMFEGGWAESA